VQNEFLVLTQNLVLPLSQGLETQESIRDEQAEEKYQKWLEQLGCVGRAVGGKVSPWVKALRTRVTRWSFNFPAGWPTP